MNQTNFLMRGKQIIFLFAFIAFFSGNALSAQQYTDHFKWFDVYGGLMTVDGTLMTIEGTDTVSNAEAGGEGPLAGIGLNLPFLYFKESSLGIHVSGNVYLNSTLGATFPVMLQYKFGTDAVLESEKDFGFGISAGYNIVFHAGEGMPSGTFYFPTCGPEISYYSSLGLLKLRLYAQFGTKESIRKRGQVTEVGNFKMPFMISLGVCRNYSRNN